VSLAGHDPERTRTAVFDFCHFAKGNHLVSSTAIAQRGYSDAETSSARDTEESGAMSVFVRALAFVLLSAVAVNAQSKRDIHGFSTGMAISQVTEQAKGGRCTRAYLCRIEGGDLELEFQSYASPKLVDRILFIFKSGAESDEMVSNVSKQFGGEPEKIESKLFGESIQKRRGGSSSVVAKWDLGDELHLRLGLSRGEPNEYALELTNHKLRSLDKEAKIAADEAAKAEKKARLRATNPKPKF